MTKIKTVARMTINNASFGCTKILISQLEVLSEYGNMINWELGMIGVHTLVESLASA